MKENIIRPLWNLEMELPLGWFTYLFNFNQTCQANGYLWYIEGPRENIVVDCGGKSETIMQYGFPARLIATPEEALNKIGLSCQDIDTVIVTHIDPDHIEEAKCFTRARIVIQKDELEFARNPHPLFQMRYPAEWVEGLNYEVLDGDTPIADGVQVIKTAGHSPGGQSVVVDTAEGKAVIAGFCSVQDNFNPPEEIKRFRPVVIPTLHCDVFQLYDSVIRVKEFADIIIPNHAPEFAARDRIP